MSLLTFWRPSRFRALLWIAAMMLLARSTEVLVGTTDAVLVLCLDGTVGGREVLMQGKVVVVKAPFVFEDGIPI
jgi:hypothetical protein